MYCRKSNGFYTTSYMKKRTENLQKSRNDFIKRSKTKPSVVEVQNQQQVEPSETVESLENPQERPFGNKCHINLGGRMIVEMDFLVEQLKSGCKNCDAKLDLCAVESNTRHGLANVFNIPCVSCAYSNRVYSSKTHYRSTAKKTRPVFDVNTKCAAGKRCCNNFSMLLSSEHNKKV